MTSLWHHLAVLLSASWTSHWIKWPTALILHIMLSVKKKVTRWGNPLCDWTLEEGTSEGNTMKEKGAGFREDDLFCFHIGAKMSEGEEKEDGQVSWYWQPSLIQQPIRFKNRSGDDDDDDGGDEGSSEVEVSLARLVQVQGAGFWGAPQVEASQGVAGQRFGALGHVTLLQDVGTGGERRRCRVAGGVEAGATLDHRHFWPVGGATTQVPGVRVEMGIKQEGWWLWNNIVKLFETSWSWCLLHLILTALLFIINSKKPELVLSFLVFPKWFITILLWYHPLHFALFLFLIHWLWRCS